MRDLLFILLLLLLQDFCMQLLYSMYVSSFVLPSKSTLSIRVFCAQLHYTQTNIHIILSCVLWQTSCSNVAMDCICSIEQLKTTTVPRMRKKITKKIRERKRDTLKSNKSKDRHLKTRPTSSVFVIMIMIVFECSLLYHQGLLYIFIHKKRKSFQFIYKYTRINAFTFDIEAPSYIIYCYRTKCIHRTSLSEKDYEH